MALADNVVEVTEEYLGVAAKRFVARQISFHLGKRPEELKKEDIPQLAEWIKVSMAFLTEDKIMVDSLAQKLINLAK